METEEEQVEKLKNWWQENGKSVIAGIVIGVGGLFGYRYWVEVQETTAANASVHFEQMISALEAGNVETTVSQAEVLLENFGDTEYATLARFALAKHYVKEAAFENAERELQQIVGSAGDQPLAFLARKRLASVQLQLARLDQALVTLSIDFPAEFSASVEELKGDIYARQGRNSEAAEAYRLALKGTPGPANAEFIQQKLDDLGSTG